MVDKQACNLIGQQRVNLSLVTKRDSLQRFIFNVRRYNNDIVTFDIQIQKQIHGYREPKLRDIPNRDT